MRAVALRGPGVITVADPEPVAAVAARGGADPVVGRDGVTSITIVMDGQILARHVARELPRALRRAGVLST